MAPAPFCVFFLMILVTVRGVVDEPVEDYYTYAFETLVSAVFILAGFNCYLLLQKGSSCKSTPPKRQADAEVQCDLSNSSQIENMTPAGAIFFRLMVPDGMWGKIAGTWRLPWNPLSWPPAKVALLNTCKGSGLIVSLCRHCGILGVYIYNARAALQDRIDQGTCAKAGVSYLIDLWFLMWSHYCRAAISACGSMYPPGTYIYIYMYS